MKSNKLNNIAEYLLLISSILTRKINAFMHGNLFYQFFVKIISKLGIDRGFTTLFLKLGVTPIAVAQMRDDNNMLIDLRSGTEFRSFFSSEYDSNLIDLLHTLLSPEKYFLDIGANVGFYTVSIASRIRKLKGDGKVISFEPLEGNYRRLVENISLNNLENYCSSFPIGLSNSCSNGTITLREDFLNGSTTGNASISIDNKFDAGFDTASIKLESLDYFWMNTFTNEIRIGIIKMDIEGHEDLCLEGGQKTLKEHRPTILMEVNKPYFNVRGINLDERISKLIPDDYSFFSERRGKWNKISSLVECRSLDNIFLVPNEALVNSNYKIFITE